MMEVISEEENDEEESDDLSRLSYLDGTVILDTLRQRYRENKYYVCIKLAGFFPTDTSLTVKFCNSVLITDKVYLVNVKTFKSYISMIDK